MRRELEPAWMDTDREWLLFAVRSVCGWQFCVVLGGPDRVRPERQIPGQRQNPAHRVGQVKYASQQFSGEAFAQ